MGMIMKDGIPYGGIYPIDDAPTQGSNNAVKSGGVHSALSNKVDKVAGKGLSTNDYDNTEKEQNEANAEAIEAIVNVNGCCNVIDIDNPISLSNVRVAYNGIVNTEIDTKTAFNCWIATFDSSGQQIQGIFSQNIDSTGHKVLNITIPNSNYYSLQLRHNGSIRDLAINVPAVPAGDYKMSFDVVGYNPSTVGGLDIRNIMLYDARLNPTGYVHYAMTNEQLTEKTKDISSYVIEDGGVVRTCSKLGNIIIVGIQGTFTGGFPQWGYFTIPYSISRVFYQASTPFYVRDNQIVAGVAINAGDTVAWYCIGYVE